MLKVCAHAEWHAQTQHACGSALHPQPCRLVPAWDGLFAEASRGFPMHCGSQKDEKRGIYMVHMRSPESV